MVVAAILQSSLLPRWSILHVTVNLILLLVVAWSIRRGIEAGLILAIIGGVALDILSVAPLGSSVIALGFAAIFAGSVGPGLRRTSVLLPLLITPVSSVIATLVAAFVLYLLGPRFSWSATVVLVVLPSAILDSAAMLVVYPLVSFIDHRAATSDWPG